MPSSLIPVKGILERLKIHEDLKDPPDTMKKNLIDYGFAIDYS